VVICLLFFNFDVNRRVFEQLASWYYTEVGRTKHNCVVYIVDRDTERLFADHPFKRPGASQDVEVFLEFAVPDYLLVEPLLHFCEIAGEIH
jgi:hypothetical protein